MVEVDENLDGVEEEEVQKKEGDEHKNLSEEFKDKIRDHSYIA